MLSVFEIVTTKIFDNWYERLKDTHVKDRIQARIYRAAHGNFGDWKTEAGEVKAMRIDYGPGYRLYYVIRENKLVILLCGGDKRTQSADIEKAAKLAKEV